MRTPRPTPPTALLVIVLTAGCGRIGYDDLREAGAGGSSATDGAVGGQAGVSGGGAGGDGPGSGGGAGAGGTPAAGDAGSGGESGGEAGTGGAGGAGGLGPGPGGASGLDSGMGGTGIMDAGTGGAAAGAGGASSDAGSQNPPSDPAGDTVTVADPRPTAQVGSPGLGTDYLDVCPPGEAVIGYLGTQARSPTMPWLQAVQTQCGRLVVGPGPGYAVTTTTGTLHPAHGLENGESWTLLCPPNQVVIGFEGRQSDWVAQVAFHCAPLAVVAGAGGYMVSVGSVTKTGSAGSNAGSPFEPISCPAGQIAAATAISTDSYPRSFGLHCGTPTLVP